MSFQRWYDDSPIDVELRVGDLGAQAVAQVVEPSGRPGLVVPS